MKKIFTLLVAIAASMSMMAQHSGAMQFAGKANISIPMIYNADVASDTVCVSDANTAITLPVISGQGMAIPSMKIGNLTYTMTGNPMMGNAVFTWEKADTTFTVGEKDVNLKNFKVTYEHAKNKLTVSANIKYGKMPFPLAYTQEGYYIKDVAGDTKISIGGVYNYTATPTYRIRKYIEDEVEKVDVEIPTYKIAGTVMGDLTLGTYTVKGLIYDSEKEGYYRDYANDGLIMHFKAEGTMPMDNDYSLSTAGGENILVQYNGTSIVYIENNFQPGAMPFPISATYGTKKSVTGIQNVNADTAVGNGATYNLSGQRVGANAKGIVIRNGKKYIVK